MQSLGTSGGYGRQGGSRGALMAQRARNPYARQLPVPQGGRTVAPKGRDPLAGRPGTPDGGAEPGPTGEPKRRLARLTLQPSHRVVSPRNLAGVVLLAALDQAQKE